MCEKKKNISEEFPLSLPHFPLPLRLSGRGRSENRLAESDAVTWVEGWLGVVGVRVARGGYRLAKGG